MLPDGPFDIVVADPPWRFASNSKAKPGRNAMRHYACMTQEEINALPVREIATREHSRKPDELQDHVDSVWPAARNLEMFARTPRLGWAQFGNEVEKFAVAAE